MANPVELAHELFGRNGTKAQLIELAKRKCIPNYEITEMSLLGNRRLVFQNFCSVLNVDKKMGRFAATVAQPKTFLLRPDLCIGFGAVVLVVGIVMTKKRGFLRSNARKAYRVGKRVGGRVRSLLRKSTRLVNGVPGCQMGALLVQRPGFFPSSGSPGRQVLATSSSHASPALPPDSLPLSESRGQAVDLWVVMKRGGGSWPMTEKAFDHLGRLQHLYPGIDST